MEYFEILPDEITLDILSRVPTESVVDCKSVCKTWNHLVSHHPLFSKMHLQNLVQSFDDSGKLSFIAYTNNKSRKKYYSRYFEYNDNHDRSTTRIERNRRLSLTPPLEYFTFVGSINGLICLTAYSRQPFRICNPITKEYVVLPQTMAYYLACGFGYVSSTDEYKIVVMGVSDSNVEVHIYTLGNGRGWRNLRNLDSRFSRPFDCVRGIFANGTLYWTDFGLEMIVSFDLADERFCENILPRMGNGLWMFSRIGVLNGILFFSNFLVRGEEYCNDIWLLNKKNDNHDTGKRQECELLGWTKEFRVEDNSKLLAFTKSNGILSYFGDYLNIYDPKEATSIRLIDFKERVCQVFPHMNTLVSLKELGEEDTKIMESVEIEETESRDLPTQP